jgi:AmmeMemoRadiSam system protein B
LSSGIIAADVFNSLKGKQFDTVITISPSHTGPFRRMTICSLDSYQTPLGVLPIDQRVCHELCDEDDDIFLDDTGHFHPQGIDVQLPFLQNVLGRFELVPVVMGEETPAFCRELGLAVGEVMFNRKTLVVASVNILNATQEALSKLWELVEQRDVPRLISLLNSSEISLHGKGPLLVALIASMHRRARHSHILKLQAPDDEHDGHLSAVFSR